MPLLTAGQILTADDLNAGLTSYTPTLSSTGATQPVLGTGGVATGWYYRLGQFVLGEALIRFGSSGVTIGTGVYLISLPTAINADTTLQTSGGGAGLVSPVGQGVVRDNNASANSQAVSLCLFSSGSVFMQAGSGGGVTDASPFIWAIDDAMAIQFFYLAA